MSTDSLERIERELSFLVRQAQRVHVRAAHGEYPLERSAYQILTLLHDEGCCRQVDVAARFQLDPSTVSRQVATLMRAGLAVRAPDPDDRRAHRIELTAQGKQAVLATRRARRDLFRKVLTAWPASDLNQFAGLLEAFNAGLGAHLCGTSRSCVPPPREQTSSLPAAGLRQKEDQI